MGLGFRCCTHIHMHMHAHASLGTRPSPFPSLRAPGLVAQAMPVVQELFQRCRLPLDQVGGWVCVGGGGALWLIHGL